VSTLVSFLAGLAFALGLGVGGVTRPSIVLGFLDVTGVWNPNLAFVMAGAVTTYALLQRWIVRQARPVLGAAFAVPSRSDLDVALIGGPVLFGIGWGLVGFCPGPAIVALGAGVPEALLFVGAMMAGMLLYEWRTARR
jgi:uncharacterized membrane protein YedE/YeeE